MQFAFILVLVFGNDIVAANPIDNRLVDLATVDSSIYITMRYGTKNNFMGKVLKGYNANKCFVTRKTANALSTIQKEIAKNGFSLKMYDCYRPISAVQDMVQFVSNNNPGIKTFFPNVNKNNLIDQGYIGPTSGHSRGDTVDLSIIKISDKDTDKSKAADISKNCITGRMDLSLDMGTQYDCFDPRSFTASSEITANQKSNRQFLLKAMSGFFKNYDKEWWHYSLKNTDSNGDRFNFPIE
jgi:D-alanyl-D-alanine dipeptidase